MKTKAADRFDYVEVKDLQPGDIVLNIGIVKNVFPHASKNLIQIYFKPSRGTPISNASEMCHSMWYRPVDKLMKG